MPRVSIIAPVYNVAPYIGACIESLQSQTFGDFEVILVDDHGTDGSIDIARRYAGDDARFRVVATERNSGPGVARNVGIDAALGEYIAFIDSDDIWLSDFLELMTEAVRDYDLAYCQLQYLGGERDGMTHSNPLLPDGPFKPAQKRYFLRHFVTFSVCFLFKRQFLVDNALRFPALHNSEDTNFLTRCLLLAQSIACVDIPLYVYCVRQDSLSTGSRRGKWRQRLRALNALWRDYTALCNDPRYAALNLKQYRADMMLIWLKKGLAQAIRDLCHQ